MAMIKKLIAVNITDSFDIVTLFIPVKLINDVITAIPMMKRKKIPKYFK